MADALSAFNQLLADAWPAVQRQVQTQVKATLKTFKPVSLNSGPLTSRNVTDFEVMSRERVSAPVSPAEAAKGLGAQVTATLKRVEAEFKIEHPPVYREISEQRLHLAIPAPESPRWSVEVEVRVDVRALGVTAPVRTTVTLKEIRLELPLLLKEPEDTSDPRPKLDSIDWERVVLELDWEVRNTRESEAVERGKVRERLEVPSDSNKTVRDYLSERGLPLEGELRTKLIKAKVSTFESWLGLKATASIELRLVTAPVPGILVLGQARFNDDEKEVKPNLDGFYPLELNLSALQRSWGVCQPVAKPQKPHKLRQEAEAITETVRSLLPYGQVSNLRYKADGKEDAYVGYEDTAIWTGHCLAAHAFQYATVRREQKSGEKMSSALTRIDELLDGIGLLFAVTRQTKTRGLLARAAFPVRDKEHDAELQPSPQLDDPSIKKNVYGPVELMWNGTRRKWRGYGRGTQPITRDQYLGVLLGLAVTHELVPEVQCRIKPVVEDILHYCLTHNWGLEIPGDAVVRNTWFHNVEHQLALLCVGNRVSPSFVVKGRKLSDYYAQAKEAATLTWLTVWTDCLDPVDRYYKFNLAHTSMTLLLMLDPTPGYRSAYQMLQYTIRDHHNAYFDLIRVFVSGKYVPDGQEGHEELRAAWRRTMALTTETGGPLTLQEEIKRLIGLWLDRRSAVAGPSKVLPAQATPDRKYLVDRFPREIALYPAGMAKVDETTNVLKAKQASFACTRTLPVDKRPGANMDFIWQRDPYTTDLQLVPGVDCSVLNQAHSVGGSPRVESPGVDYLLAYWMAAYMGVVGE